MQLSSAFRLGLTSLCFLWACGLRAGLADSPFSHRHVLVIGIDGCRPDSMTEANAPHLQGLIDRGVVSFQAVAGGKSTGDTTQATSSGPGWSSILTGVWRNKHGVSDNSFFGNRFRNYPHFFQRIKQLEPKAHLASIVSWNPIDSDIVGPVDAATDYRSKGAGPTYSHRDRWVCDDAVRHLREADPDVLFLHFDQVDGAGHASGFSSTNAAYLEAIANVDHMVGEVLDAIENRPDAAREQWLVLVTTDHGGRGTSHGGQTQDERTIFLIASGENTARITSRKTPGHAAIPPTVLHYLGLPIAASWGWEEAPFGLPPYPPSGLQVTPGVGRDLVLRWDPPVDLVATQLVVKRNGQPIATLPLDATHYVDRLPPLFFALQVVYTLEVEGAAAPMAPLQATADLPKSLSDNLRLQWGFQEAPPATVHGTVPSVAGAYSGKGVHLGEAGEAGYLTHPLDESLTFGRLTDFSIGLWVRFQSPQRGTLVGTREATGLEAGWTLSLHPDGSVQWSMSDGRQAFVLRSSEETVTPGAWHHLGVTVTRFEEVTLTIDGVLAASKPLPSLGSVDGTGPLSLGAAPDGSASIDAMVDELSIWGRAVDATTWQRLHEDRAFPHHWRASHFRLDERFDPQVGEWKADPDHDGRNNLAELALGSDPRTFDAFTAPTLLQITPAEGQPILHYRQPSGGTGHPLGGYVLRGVHSELQVTPDLAALDWRPVADPESLLLSVDYPEAGTQLLSWPLPREAKRQFYRFHYRLAFETD